jgi:hypothetical protein
VEASARTYIELPVKPINSITSVKDRDGNDIEYTFDGFYLLFGPTEFTPTAPEQPEYVTTITVYEAGYTTAPLGLVLGLKEVIAHLYENRGDDTGLINMLVQNANLMPYRQKMWI